MDPVVAFIYLFSRQNDSNVHKHTDMLYLIYRQEWNTVYNQHRLKVSTLYSFFLSYYFILLSYWSMFCCVCLQAAEINLQSTIPLLSHISSYPSRSKRDIFEHLSWVTQILKRIKIQMKWGIGWKKHKSEHSVLVSTNYWCSFGIYSSFVGENYID